MAETVNVGQPIRVRGAIQDTGNPVLDSTINLLVNWPSPLNPSAEFIREVHGMIAELHAKEPGRQP
jgi:hypothetical protein